MHPFNMEFGRPKPPSNPTDQHFGLGITPQDYLTLMMRAQSNDNYNRPLRNTSAANQDVRPNMKQDRDQFQVNINLPHFRAEELTVKVADGFLVIEGNTDEREDGGNGFITRNFTRRYPLPDGVSYDLVVSKLSSDGVLNITAPRNMTPKNTDERIVPIVKTGPVKKREGGAKQ